jgi:hypothetical protein
MTDKDNLRRGLGQLSELCLRLAEHLATENPPVVEGGSPAPRDCMTKEQLADYFQVSEAAITNWQNRADHPLPCGYLGDSPRYFLPQVQQWSHDEAQRRRAARENKTGHKEPKDTKRAKPARRMPSTLTAANQSKGGKNADIQTLAGQAY